jgi:hypothetical protein
MLNQSVTWARVIRDSCSCAPKMLRHLSPIPYYGLTVPHVSVSHKTWSLKGWFCFSGGWGIWKSYHFSGEVLWFPNLGSDMWINWQQRETESVYGEVFWAGKFIMLPSIFSQLNFSARSKSLKEIISFVNVSICSMSHVWQKMFQCLLQTWCLSHFTIQSDKIIMGLIIVLCA